MAEFVHELLQRNNALEFRLGAAGRGRLDALNERRQELGAVSQALVVQRVQLLARWL